MMAMFDLGGFMLHSWLPSIIINLVDRLTHESAWCKHKASHCPLGCMSASLWVHVKQCIKILAKQKFLNILSRLESGVDLCLVMGGLLYFVQKGLWLINCSCTLQLGYCTFQINCGRCEKLTRLQREVIRLRINERPR